MSNRLTPDQLRERDARIMGRDYSRNYDTVAQLFAYANLHSHLVWSARDSEPFTVERTSGELEGNSRIVRLSYRDYCLTPDSLGVVQRRGLVLGHVAVHADPLEMLYTEGGVGLNTLFINLKNVTDGDDAETE